MAPDEFRNLGFQEEGATAGGRLEELKRENAELLRRREGGKK